MRYMAVETDDGGGAIFDTWLEWWAEFGSLEAAIWIALCYEECWIFHSANRWERSNGPVEWGPR